ncbi:MAG: aryl-sulfate sulfotransferase [Bacteroidia bacterium]|nr:aryl-sulfate sulfotransferase [Bacteroidia bacterium]
MKKLVKFLIIFWVSFFALVFIMGVTRHVVLNGSGINGAPKEIVLFLSTFGRNVVDLVILQKPLEILQKPLVIRSTLSLKNGFNRTKNYRDSNDYLLVATWNDAINQSVVKLVRIKDGKMLYKWIPDIKQLNKRFNSTYTYGIKNSLTDETTRLLHPILMPDGSLIFSGGYECGYLCKVDRNSNLIWSNMTPCHHSIEPGTDGNFWICGYNSSTRNAVKYQIRDDAIKQISATEGKILFEKSVFEILMENGYGRGCFFINPQITSNLSYLDYIHLNDVQPVLEDSKYWKKGDLFLSLRHQNLVLLYRPSTNKIIWSQNGPWLKQHDVDVIDSVRIGVFGNNAIDARFANERERLIDGHNNQYIYDFSKNEYSTPYDAFFKSANIGTCTEGQSRILGDGDIFVEETEQGRLLYGNRAEEIWSYIERIDENKICMFNWSRYITEKEFEKFTFINQPGK